MTLGSFIEQAINLRISLRTADKDKNSILDVGLKFLQRENNSFESKLQILLAILLWQIPNDVNGHEIFS